MAKRSPDISPAELEVLKALWRGGQVTVRDVLEDLHEQGRTIAYTTVLTLLNRLERKGVVASDRSGVAYVYRAKVSEDRIIGSRLKRVLGQLFDGAAAPMMLRLMETERFTPEELAELRRRIDELDTRQGEGPSGEEE